MQAARLLALICIGLFLRANTLAGPGDFPSDLAKWIVLDPPGDDSDAWLAANHSNYEWAVSLRDGRAQVERYDWREQSPSPLPFKIEPRPAKEGLSGDRLSIRVTDGWIIAFNKGEFGAGLWWFSPDGTKRDKIAEAWVRGFFPTDAGLLAIEGLAHGSDNEGRILRVAKGPGGRWRSEDFIDLKNAPEVAVKKADGSLIVATTQRLLRVVPATKKVEVLLDQTFWGGLYPNSMVIAPDETIYLGMRHGVARIEKKRDSYKCRWLLPNKEFAEMKPDVLK